LRRSERKRGFVYASGVAGDAAEEAAFGFEGLVDADGARIRGRRTNEGVWGRP
jgi:hypothetical protein